MKKLSFLFALMLFIAAQAKSQFLVGGNMSITSQNHISKSAIDETKSTLTTATILPRFGFITGNNWVGFEAGVTTLKLENPDFNNENSTDKLNLISISPFYRFIKKPTENMGIWLEAQGGVSFGSEKYNDEEISEYNGFSLGIRPGIIFYIGNHLSFEASFGRVGYNQIKVTSKANSDISETSSKLGFSLNNNNVDQLVNALLLQDEINISLPQGTGFMFGANWMF